MKEQRHQGRGEWRDNTTDQKTEKGEQLKNHRDVEETGGGGGKENVDGTCGPLSKSLRFNLRLPGTLHKSL